VIDFVAEGASQEIFAADFEGFAFGVLRFYSDKLGGARRSRGNLEWRGSLLLHAFRLRRELISGLASTIFASGFFPPVTSTTARRRFRPICGAASPTPWAAYMEANISSESCSSSASNFFMGVVGFLEDGVAIFEAMG